MDKYPWLDLTDKTSIRNSPFQVQIVEHVESAMARNPPNDEGYMQYLTEDERECPLYKNVLYDYERKLEQYHEELADYETFTQAGTIHGVKRQRSSTNTTTKLPSEKPLPPVKPNTMAKMSKKNWLEYRISLAKTEALLESVESGFYDLIPEDHIYIAQDCEDRIILVVFPKGLEFVYGCEGGRRYADILVGNIQRYAESQPPPFVLDSRHAHHKWWLSQEGNEHFQPPKGRCGVYHWGTWLEQGQTQRGPIWSKDYRAGGTQSGVSDGAYAVRLRQGLIQSFGNMTRAIDFLFRIVDNPMREQYRMTWKKLQPATRIATIDDELFTLRAILVNVLTEVHTDCNDWKNGWAWIGIVGDFTNGDLCMPQLGIQVPMPAGSITGMRGRDFQHFITRWSGKQRYSIVHSYWDSIRQHVEQAQDSDKESTH